MIQRATENPGVPHQKPDPKGMELRTGLLGLSALVNLALTALILFPVPSLCLWTASQFLTRKPRGGLKKRKYKIGSRFRNVPTAHPLGVRTGE